MGRRELKRASVPVWGSLLPLKRTNQRFSYFMRSLPAVSLSLYQFATWEAKFLSLTHSWCCTVHNLCTHIVVGTDSSLLYPPMVHTPLWSKQTTHFDTIHGALHIHTTIPLWALSLTRTDLSLLCMAGWSLSICKPHQKINIILTMTEKTIEELMLGPLGANLINCEI